MKRGVIPFQTHLQFPFPANGVPIPCPQVFSPEQALGDEHIPGHLCQVYTHTRNPDLPLFYMALDDHVLEVPQVVPGISPGLKGNGRDMTAPDDIKDLPDRFVIPKKFQGRLSD